MINSTLIKKFFRQGYPTGKLSSMSEKINSSNSPLTGTPKSQSGTPRPASAGAGGSLPPAGTPSSAGHSDSESSQPRPAGASGNNSVAAHRSEVGAKATSGEPGDGVGAMALPGAAVSPSGSPSILSAHLQGDVVQRSIDCLSKEQLEHRERSLQTLRDIERLFLRRGTPGGPGDPGGSNNGPNNPPNLNTNAERSVIEDPDNGTSNSGNMLPSAVAAAPAVGMKKYEEPLQSMISQTQSLVGPALDSPQMESHLQQMSSPGDPMGPLLGPEGLSREQMAWRKLQEEYYQEKRRQQEMQPPGHPQHFRMIPEVGMHGGSVMMRGPPPPYHSKLGDQQWGPTNLIRGGMGGNGRMVDLPQDVPRGPRFLGQIQRGQPGGGGFPGSPGGGLPIETIGPQRSGRPGMIWPEDMPNNVGGGGLFHGCYPGGPSPHFQGDSEFLTREEMFRIMEKRHVQGVSRFELDRLAKQQQQGNMGARIMEGLGGPDFPNMGMGRGPPSGRGDPMDFPGSREMMGSPGACPQMRDLVDSPLGGSVPMSMTPQMNLQQQQMMLSQRRRGTLGEMFGPGEIPRIGASQNGRGGNKGMIPGPEGPFQFPGQGPFSDGPVDGPYLQQPGPEMFGPEPTGQIGGTSRLSHLPLTEDLRGPDLGSRHASDMSASGNPLASPSLPPAHQLKSPSLSQAPSPLLPSPSAPGLKSPISSGGHHPTFPPASGAGTPCSTSLKSPQIMGSSSLGLHSPANSPGQLKSPAMAMGSPAWTGEPKAALSSPGGLTGGKVVGNGGSGSTDTGPVRSKPKSVVVYLPFSVQSDDFLCSAQASPVPRGVPAPPPSANRAP